MTRLTHLGMHIAKVVVIVERGEFMNHILLVDDDEHFRRSLVIQLELSGYHVTEAEGGEQALDFLKKGEACKSPTS
jgi:ActR/RegA family two-component response regulator